ncbi:inner membrane transport permease YbhR [Clostridium puniceum]|uniref:Inner membrane transport permease YbhR n=1 Tax=Clostridium puniceum TaxID=29367 RepID=A0A1S8TN03_9CLOT|nr:ABC transporter permease [Clostridium puniceum]OOM79029.1 inner membrane transport permease YbhR [Clostridium puniceum]
MRALLNVVKKELLLWFRNKGTFSIGFISPIIILLLTVVMFGLNGYFSIGLLVKDKGQYGKEMANIIREDPSWKVITENESESRDLYDSGRIFLIVTIPENFSDTITINKKAVLDYELNNSFSDVTKNARLRIDNSVNKFNMNVLGIEVPQVKFYGLLPEDIPRTSYLAVGAIVYALIFGGIINGGFLVSREWEEETIKEILLCRSSSLIIIVGKMLSASIMTLINAAFVWLVSSLLFEVKFQGSVILCTIFILITTISQVGLGVFLGTSLRRFVLLVPPAGVLGVGGFFLCGGFSHYLQLPAISRLVAKYIPLTYAFDAVQKTFHSNITRGLVVDLVVLIICAIVLLLASVFSLKKELKCV